MYYLKEIAELKSYELEFSKMYKRLLTLETIIKAKIKDAVIQVYKKECYNKFSNFFNKKKLIEQYNTISAGNPFLAVLCDKEIDEVKKFVNLVDMLYLRHTLQLILDIHEFWNEDIQNKFYKKKPKTFAPLRNHRLNIINLRNDIAHLNFTRYKQNKLNYIEGLLLYEIHIGCNLGELEKLPDNLGYKPSASAILKKIYELKPDLFNSKIPHSNYHCKKDRIIVELYEDIAVLNGWDYNDLKSPWEIIRTKFTQNKKRREAKLTDKINTENVIENINNTSEQIKSSQLSFKF